MIRMKPCTTEIADEPLSAQWDEKAQRERDALNKYPASFDHEHRLRLAEMYERYAAEAREHETTN